MDDVAAEVDRLERVGVTVREPAHDLGPVILAIIEDAEGNPLQVAQAKPMG